MAKGSTLYAHKTPQESFPEVLVPQVRLAGEGIFFCQPRRNSTAKEREPAALLGTVGGCSAFDPWVSDFHPPRRLPRWVQEAHEP